MPSFKWIAAALAGVFVYGPAAAQSTVYKWTDSQGKVHFSDTPPTEQAKEITQKRMGGGEVDATQLPYATQQAMKRSPVTLYTAPQCGDPCADGRALLGNRGIPYSERNAQGSAADADQVIKLIGALQVPVLVVGSDPLKGYDESAWHAALDGAGYPRTKLPGSLAPKPVVVPPEQPGAASAPAEAEPAR